MIDKKIIIMALIVAGIIFYSGMITTEENTDTISGQILKHNDKSIIENTEDIQAAKSSTNYGFKKDTLIIKFKAGVTEDSKDKLLKRYRLQKEKDIKSGIHVITVPVNSLEKIKQALSNNPKIEFVEKDMLVPAIMTAEDPYSSKQYHISLMHYPEAWNISTGTEEIIVAAPDSGILSSHEDLKNVLLTELSYNSADGTNNSEPVTGHGTATAGCIGADTNNSIGISSAPWKKKIIPIRITNNADGWAYYTDMVEGIIYAADNGAKVVSVSYGGIGSYSIKSAAGYVKEKGGLFFMSAGNSGSYEIHQAEGNWNEIIGVAATTSSDTRSSFSSYGNYVDISAPGSSVYTTSGSGYGAWSGTSFSSPLAASVAALLFSAFPSASNHEVEQAIFTGAKDLGEEGYDIYYGHGRVDALGAMEAMQNRPIDTTPPTISINYPKENEKISADTTIEIGAIDLFGISKVELYVNGILYGTDNSANNDIYDFYWDISTLENGEYELLAIAYDTSGNTANDIVSVMLEKDTNFPEINITTPAEGSTITEKFSTIIASASENTVSVDFHINGAFKGTDSSSPFSYRFNTRPYEKETIIIQATAYTTGGLSTYTSVSAKIDLNPIVTETPECSDGKDNDGDKKCDYNGCAKNKIIFYDADPDCTGPDDNSESS